MLCVKCEERHNSGRAPKEEFQRVTERRKLSDCGGTAGHMMGECESHAEGRYSLVVATADSPHLDAVAALLDEAWPRGGGREYFRRRLPSLSLRELPCSLILLNTDPDDPRRTPVPVGHARLTACGDRAATTPTAVAATYVATAPRRRGHGRALLRRLENAVRHARPDFRYVYVWTRTAVDFYRRCGYHETNRVALHQACLRGLEAAQVTRLESLLSSRVQQQLPELIAEQQIYTETVLLPPEDGVDQDQNDDVWLRKRLIEFAAPCRIIPAANRMLELMPAMRRFPNHLHWRYCLLEVPHVRQVGPSCGLVALLMLRAAAARAGDGADGDSAVADPGLLAAAIQRGYSQDGELFNVDHLVELARDLCGLNCEMMSMREQTAAGVLELLRHRRPIVLAYDAQPGTQRPFCNDGAHAHYGIIVGALVGRPVVSDGDALPHEACQKKEFEAIAPDTPGTIADVLEQDSLVLLLVQHGGSDTLAAAAWDAFYDSNQQLRRADAAAGPYATDYNLADHLVVFETLTHASSRGVSLQS